MATKETTKQAAAKPASKAKKADAAAVATTGEAMSYPKGYVPRLKAKYEKDIVPMLTKNHGYKNVHQVPKLTKIVLNMGVGDATTDSRKPTQAAEELTQIAGQRAVVTRATKSIATFKVRENMPLGCKVTLRGNRMYEFLDCLINIALPRVRDFRGLSPRSFDGRGNYALGLKEHIVFPQINYDKVEKVRGMDIVICTTANSNAEAKDLLKALNMPIRDR